MTQIRKQLYLLRKKKMATPTLAMSIEVKRRDHV